MDSSEDLVRLAIVIIGGLCVVLLRDLSVRVHLVRSLVINEAWSLLRENVEVVNMDLFLEFSSAAAADAASNEAAEDEETSNHYQGNTPSWQGAVARVKVIVGDVASSA